MNNLIKQKYEEYTLVNRLNKKFSIKYIKDINVSFYKEEIPAPAPIHSEESKTELTYTKKQRAFYKKVMLHIHPDKKQYRSRKYNRYHICI